MNPDVFAGPARRLTPQEWADACFRADKTERVVDEQIVPRYPAPWDAWNERAAQGGRG